jgi:hypothetical protein
VSRPPVLALAASLCLLLGCGSGGEDAATQAPPARPGSATNAEQPNARRGVHAAAQAQDAGDVSGQGGPPQNGTSDDQAQQRGGAGQGQGAAQGQNGGAVPGDASTHYTPRPHHDSGGGAGQFETKGGDNSIEEFGNEAGGSELAEAATALHGYLDARAAGAWAAACEYLADGVSRQLSQLAGKGGGEAPSCAQILAGLSGGLPPAALRQAALADVGALRVEGERSFLLFHGSEGSDYFIPTVSEGGNWKVAAIAPSPLS